jgi:hypothetical protein
VSRFVLLDAEAWRLTWQLLVRVATMTLDEVADRMADGLERLEKRMREYVGEDGTNG